MSFLKPKFWDENKISLLAILLFPITLLIQLLIFFKTRLTKNNNCSIPIICVGNIYLGGTGKTPLCVEIFLILKKLNMNPAFVRSKHDSFQDEANLQKQFGQVYQNKNRVKAVKEAIKNKANIVILDDGFQDFSINKNLSIVCFNKKQWIGNGLTIPSGPLRENLSGLKRANCAFINGEKNSDIENKIFSKNREIKIFYFNYKPKNIGEFHNKKIVAFAGIGNPENFFDLLIKNKINVVEKIKFSDHHKYSENELKNLLNKIKDNDSILLTTEKDYFRIPENYKKDIKCLKIEIEIKNKNKFIEEVKKII